MAHLKVTLSCDGFSYREGNHIHIKALAYSCEELQLSGELHFDTTYLEHHSEAAKAVYRVQETLHGYNPFEWDGRPQETVGICLRDLRQAVSHFATIGRGRRPVAFFCKRRQKLETLQRHLGETIVNLEALDCPRFDQLSGNRTETTIAKAEEYGKWLAAKLDNGQRLPGH